MRDLINQAAEMDLNGSTPYPMALRMGMSEAADYFGSKPFAGFRSQQEARQKMHAALLSRFDNVIKGIGMLGRALGGLGGRRR